MLEGTRAYFSTEADVIGHLDINALVFGNLETGISRIK